VFVFFVVTSSVELILFDIFVVVDVDVVVVDVDVVDDDDG
jgi:hypothetical protein